MQTNMMEHSTSTGPAELLCCDCGSSFTASPYGVFSSGRAYYPKRCTTCSVAADEREKVAKIERAKAAIAEQWAGICPFEFRLVSEGGNTDLDRMDRECPKWRGLLDWRFGHRGLLVRGETGRCKTRGMWRVLRALFDSNVRFKWLTASAFERRYRDAIGDFAAEEYINSLVETPVLFIDDLGKFAATEAVQAAFFDLCDSRTRDGRPILVTTNDTGASLAARLSDDRGAPLVRRLQDFCDLITI